MNDIIKLMIVDVENGTISKLYQVQDCKKCEKYKGQLEEFANQTFDGQDFEYAKSILTHYIEKRKKRKDLRVCKFVDDIIDHKNIEQQKKEEAKEQFRKVFTTVRSALNGFGMHPITNKQDDSATTALGTTTNTRAYIATSDTATDTKAYTTTFDTAKNAKTYTTTSDTATDTIAYTANKKAEQDDIKRAQEEISDKHTETIDSKEKGDNLSQNSDFRAKQVILSQTVADKPVPVNSESKNLTPTNLADLLDFGKMIKELKDAQQSQSVKTKPVQSTTPQYSVLPTIPKGTPDFGKIVSDAQKNQELEYDDQGNPILTARQMSRLLY